MSKLLCKKGLVLCLFPHRTNVFDICYNYLTETILTNVQNIHFLKLLNTIFFNNLLPLLPLKQRICDTQIVIITNFIIVLSVCIKRAVYSTILLSTV